MSVRPLQVSDVDWAVLQLAERRRSLAAFAPVLWRSASDAEERHRVFLTHLLGDGRAVGFRTDDDLMLAQPQDQGWVVDDVAVDAGRWHTEGAALWEALGPAISDPVRWVCPVPEQEQRAFVEELGFTLAESWWHLDVGGGAAPIASGGDVHVPGASARLVTAPPVYAPGGPVLFLTAVAVAEAGVLTAAREQAARAGAPLVVVSQPFGTNSLGDLLRAEGFRRHCDFLGPAPA